MGNFDDLIAHLRQWSNKESSPGERMLGRGGGLHQWATEDGAAAEQAATPEALQQTWSAPELLPGQMPPMLARPEEDVAAPAPIPGSAPIPPGAVPQAIAAALSGKPAASAGKPSSRAKHTGDTAAVAIPTKLATEAAAAPGSIDQGLKDRGAGLSKERQDILQKALSEENISPEEKLILSLLAVLPGVVGTIGGGIAGGGLGALQGAAGGFGGGAAGIGMIGDEKKARRKELLGQADKLAAREDVIEGQKLDRAGTTEQRAYAAGESEKDRALRASEGAAGRRASMRETIMKGKMDMDRTLAEIAGKANAAGEAPKMTEQQERSVLVLPTMLTSASKAEQLEGKLDDLPQASQGASALNWLAPETFKSDTYKEYRRNASAWTAAYLYKISGATARPDEIETHVKDFFVMPGDSPDLVREKIAGRNNIHDATILTLRTQPQILDGLRQSMHNNAPSAHGAPQSPGAAAPSLWSKGRPVGAP